MPTITFNVPDVLIDALSEYHGYDIAVRDDPTPPTKGAFVKQMEIARMRDIYQQYYMKANPQVIPDITIT